MIGQLKLSKVELKQQQLKLVQYEKYLPVLDLKKILLQDVLRQLEQEKEELSAQLLAAEEEIASFSHLFATNGASFFFSSYSFRSIQKRIENVAGVEVPFFVQLDVIEPSIPYAAYPHYLFSLKTKFFAFMELRAKKVVLEQRYNLIAKEFRSVSIKVNLFEKILIPKTKQNIKRIRIALEEIQLSQIGIAKKAKEILLKRGGR